MARQLAPLPLRFFAVEDNDLIAAYVKRLSKRQPEAVGLR